MRMLENCADKTTQLLNSGHQGIAGSEEANACAKQAKEITNGAPQPVSSQPAHLSVEHIWTRRRLSAEQRRSTPRRLNV